MQIFQPNILNTQIQNETLIAKRWANFQDFVAKIDYVKTVKKKDIKLAFWKMFLKTA
ncbi:MAG: hypothetical protein GXZ15_00595 [Campylobacter sp.]|nr:hypothetical protein [Campylobacter sp.]